MTKKLDVLCDFSKESWIFSVGQVIVSIYYHSGLRRDIVALKWNKE